MIDLPLLLKPADPDVLYKMTIRLSELALKSVKRTASEIAELRALQLMVQAEHAKSEYVYASICESEGVTP